MSEALVHLPAATAEYPPGTTLEVLEAVVENTIGVARQALLTIKERRLYAPKFATWELYCVERWGKSRAAIWRQLQQAKAERALPAGAPVPSQRALAREKGAEAAALKTSRTPPESPGDGSVPRDIQACNSSAAMVTGPELVAQAPELATQAPDDGQARTSRTPPESPGDGSVPRDIQACNSSAVMVGGPELVAQAPEPSPPTPDVVLASSTPGERVWALLREVVEAGASAEDVVAAAMAAQVGVEDRRSSAAGMWRLVATLVKAVGQSLAPTDEPEMVLAGVAYRQVKGTIRWERVPQDETVVPGALDRPVPPAPVPAPLHALAIEDF